MITYGTSKTSLSYMDPGVVLLFYQKTYYHASVAGSAMVAAVNPVSVKQAILTGLHISAHDIEHEST
jgi:hypothetical protein